MRDHTRSPRANNASTNGIAERNSPNDTACIQTQLPDRLRQTQSVRQGGPVHKFTARAVLNGKLKNKAQMASRSTKKAIKRHKGCHFDAGKIMTHARGP